MKLTSLPLIAGLLLSLPGCAVYREATGTAPPATGTWQSVATDADRQRIRNWHRAWDEALPLARKADARAIAGDALLFDPDRALPDPTLPAGRYHCRTFKLGSAGTAVRDFTAYPPFDCTVSDEGEVKSLHKVTGSQRPTGLIFPNVPGRSIFLGTLILGDETAPLRYGLDPDRDMIGYIERIAARRWRLVLPYPRFESKLDVIELVPAG